MFRTQLKRSHRRHSTQVAIERQKHIVKSLGIGYRSDQLHRYSKRRATNCGNSKCAMCGNPRKFFKQKTLQEKRFAEQCKLDAQNSLHLPE